jgi:membrane-bound lytic murein transglycosylase B
MDRARKQLTELVIRQNQYDNYSLIEVVLGNENLSDFFTELDNYSNLQSELDQLLEEIRQIKGETEEETKALAEQKDKELNVKAEIETEKRKVATKQGEKKGLLNLSKQAEATYSQVIAEKQKQAEQIRAALFKLRDTQGITFGEALKYANEASKVTGVRPAFILAILKQESNLGQNVGTCNRAGDPPAKKWYSIMPGPDSNSSRDDQTIFLRITKALGLDPETTPLSCPFSVGWGGAMGPSQFIPSTWSAYEARIGRALGVTTPNPWNPKHAVFATALYVQDLGAAGGTYTAERTAALKYYAGGNWYLPQNAFYGNGVMSHATTFQEQMDFLDEL